MTIWSREFYCVAEGDFLLLVEEAKGFLEVFLATVESLVDVFGVTLVGESHFAAISLEMVEDGVGEVINAHLLDFGKAVNRSPMLTS